MRAQNVVKAGHIADAELRSVWPECKYRPQSAVEGRVYLISQQEAEELHVKQVISCICSVVCSL